jgi:hypothetical protein
MENSTITLIQGLIGSGLLFAFTLIYVNLTTKNQ